MLAEKFGGDTVVNLSNIEKVYTDDPRKNPEAKPLDQISWADFRKMVGDEWVPGKNKDGEYVPVTYTFPVIFKLR